MAADTIAKRWSAVNLICPWRGRLPIPDDNIEQGDRQTVAGLYSGILATIPEDAVISADPLDYMPTRPRGYDPTGYWPHGPAPENPPPPPIDEDSEVIISVGLATCPREKVVPVFNARSTVVGTLVLRRRMKPACCNCDD